MTLEEDYHRLCSTPSDIVDHLPTFVTYVQQLNAQHVIELGTRTGVSTVAFLYALEQTGGRLTSVDLDERPDIGDHDHWTFIQGDDLASEVVAQLDQADIVFVDTSHAYEQTYRELNLYRWFVKPGGVILCHDTMLMNPQDADPGDPRFPVRKAIERFCREQGYQWWNYEHCYGLGIIQL
jgi:predicted O-methyltransferase YrrM